MGMARVVSQKVVSDRMPVGKKKNPSAQDSNAPTTKLVVMHPFLG